MTTGRVVLGGAGVILGLAIAVDQAAGRTTSPSPRLMRPISW
jgi:hypothetical protein